METTDFFNKIKQHCTRNVHNCKQCCISSFCYDVAIKTANELNEYDFDIINQTVDILSAMYEDEAD